MKLKVKCPWCEITIPMRVRDMASPVACVTCGRNFVVVEDCEIACPRCDTIVIVPPGQAKDRVACLSCGFAFGESRILLFSRKLFYTVALIPFVFSCLLIAIGLIVHVRKEIINSSEEAARNLFLNQNMALDAIYEITNAQRAFKMKYDKYGTALGLYATNLIDYKTATAISSGEHNHGYIITMNVTDDAYRIEASPARPGITGNVFIREYNNFSFQYDCVPPEPVSEHFTFWGLLR